MYTKLTKNAYKLEYHVSARLVQSWIEALMVGAVNRHTLTGSVYKCSTHRKALANKILQMVIVGQRREHVVIEARDLVRSPHDRSHERERKQRH